MFEHELQRGFEIGRQFAANEANLEVDHELVADTARDLQEVVDNWPFQCSGPFVTLVSSVVGAAAAARSVNEFPQLTSDDLIGYFAHSASILDSLKHV